MRYTNTAVLNLDPPISHLVLYSSFSALGLSGASADYAFDQQF
jgi:hypothetical protein